MSSKQSPSDALKKNIMINELISGLHTDGAHHKQHTLETVLKLLVGEEEFEDIKFRERWEEGIPS